VTGIIHTKKQHDDDGGRNDNDYHEGKYVLPMIYLFPVIHPFISFFFVSLSVLRILFHQLKKEAKSGARGRRLEN